MKIRPTLECFVAAALFTAGVTLVAAQTDAGGASRRSVVIRAGHLFDGKSGTLAANETILVEADRITAVGASVQAPPGATVIDLSRATVLPGMIDTHIHLYDQQNGQSVTSRGVVAMANAVKTLNA